MMLHSRTRVPTLISRISRRLPKALIITAGLSVAGCGGRFLETPTALSRAQSSRAEREAGRTTLEDAPDESEAGVRAGARRFLATLFRRDSQSTEPLRDPFLDTPVFAHAETSDAEVGVARTADDEIRRPSPETATARVSPSRTIVRPPRRSDASAQPQIDDAAARMAAIAARREQPQTRNSDLPEWATGSEQPAAAQLAQRQTDASPWTPTETAKPAGRVRIGHLQSGPARAETPPEPSRRMESLLAERRSVPEPSGPLVGRQPLVAQRPATPVVERPAPTPTRSAAVVVRELPELPPWATARQEKPVDSTPAQPRAADTMVAVEQPRPSADRAHQVRDLPAHFENILALAEAPAPARTPQPVQNVTTTEASTHAETWETATIAGVGASTEWNDGPSRSEALPEHVSSDSPFPVLNEWRGVGANMPAAIADRGNLDTRSEFEIHQTGFEAESVEIAMLTGQTGAQTVAAAGIPAVAPAPPAEVSSQIRSFSSAPPEPEQSGTLLPWFLGAMIAVGLGVFAYRRHVQPGDS